MKTLRLIGLFLILAGITMIATRDFGFQQKRKIIHSSVVTIPAKKAGMIKRPWLAGSIAVLGGLALFAIGGKRNHSSLTNPVLID